MMTPMIVIAILFAVVLTEALLMARQEVSRLRDIVDQWEEELQETDTDEKWVSGWSKMK
tara:strand:+ start:605 stop:781 length:177 start_codon:yes stop_codon:yes gene_type:complete